MARDAAVREDVAVDLPDGAPSGQRKQVPIETGHILPRRTWVAESMKWLDKQCGPVARTN